MALMVTTYGVISVVKTGSCGCMGHPIETTGLPRFLARNSVVFGAGIFAVQWGPDSSNLADRVSPLIIALVSVSPLLVILMAIGRNRVEMYRQDTKVYGPNRLNGQISELGEA